MSATEKRYREHCVHLASSRRAAGAGGWAASRFTFARPGESLRTIAGRVLGSPDRWVALADLNTNRSVDPAARLRAGQRVRVA